MGLTTGGSFRLRAVLTFLKSWCFVEAKRWAPRGVFLLSALVGCFAAFVVCDPYRTFGLWVSKTYYVFAIECMKLY